MPVTFFSLSLAEAQQMITAVLHQAQTDGGKPVAVAVVDATARLIAFAAMDGVVPASRKLSQSKAYSAVVGQQDTVHWASMPKQERVVDFDMRNWTDENFSGFTGGLVVTHRGQVIGGIGVSGRKGKRTGDDEGLQDSELAELGKSILTLT